MSVRVRVGLIVPSSNTVMEPDLHQHLSGALVSTTRILLEEVTREAEMRMLAEDLPRAAELIETTAPDVVVFGCTSAGSLGGLAHEDRIRQMLEERTGAKSITVLRAVLDQLRNSGSRRIALFTPYEEELTGSVANAVAQGGCEVVQAEGMGIRENLEIGRVTPEEIAAFVEARMANLSVDAVFLSCTNWRALEAVRGLRSRLGVPVLSSNLAVLKALEGADCRCAL